MNCSRFPDYFPRHSQAEAYISCGRQPLLRDILEPLSSLCNVCFSLSLSLSLSLSSYLRPSVLEVSHGGLERYIGATTAPGRPGTVVIGIWTQVQNI